MSDKKQTTNVQQVDVDLNDILGTGVDVAMVPNEGSADPNKKPSMFSRNTVDTSFLDNPPAGGDDEPPAGGDDNPPAGGDNDPPAGGDDTPPAGGTDTPPAGVDDPFAPPGSDDNPPTGDDDEKNKGGRPTVVVGALKNLFDSKILAPFDDDKKLEDYTQADIEELIKANIEHKESQFQETLPEQFFSNMPEEMRQAYAYIANGGQDLKGLFQAMSASQEIKEVDISTEAGQAYAVRSYLQATQFGSAEEIEDEIISLKDRGDLEKRAAQFKPKLDALGQNMVNQRLAAQEESNRKRQQQSQQYVENVYKTLEGGELNGIKLNNKIQEMLYAGLVQPNYPSVSGKQTNQLGHLLEKYQWVEPNHGLIAEALWLLADPDGYRDEIRKQGGQQQNADTIRKLKTEQQAGKNGGSAQPGVDDDDATRRNHQRPNAIPRPKKGFFGR